MTMKLGKTVAERNGYAIRERYEEDADGNFVLVGYGVFHPDGTLMQSFPTIEAAQDYLDTTVPSVTSTSRPKP